MTRDALHRTICLDPTDNTLRAVYADCLEETAQGQSDYDWAEFIRLQLEHPGRDAEHSKNCTSLAGSPSIEARWFCYKPECRYLRERELLMNRQNYGAWTKNLPGVDYYSIDEHNRPIFGKAPQLLPPVNLAYRYFWECGFPQTIHVLSMLTWMQIGPALVEAAPVLRVDIGDREPEPRGRWVWFEEVVIGTLRSSNIPSEIFRWLPGRRHLPIGNGAATYESEKDARQALSEACIDWARNKARMPTIFFKSPSSFDRAMRQPHEPASRPACYDPVES
jgi:uncharacterized protein (TIGR02996 family)